MHRTYRAEGVLCQDSCRLIPSLLSSWPGTGLSHQPQVIRAAFGLFSVVLGASAPWKCGGEGFSLLRTASDKAAAAQTAA